MKIAVLSGKGGTGKTFVSVNLAASAGNAAYIDCDVEEPNGRLFLKPEGVTEETVSVKLPAVDAEACTGCRKCVNFCRFNALVFIKKRPKVFPGVCHSCGGCAIVCPENAVSEYDRPVGTVETGRHGELRVVTGVLNPGEESGVPVIKAAMKKGFSQAETVVIDCPPGSACPVMESVSEADYCVLVAEPTAFGLHNFKMVHELVGLLHKPCCVVFNKESESYAPLEAYCEDKQIPVALHIPYSAKLAALGAQAQVASEQDEACRAMFAGLLERIRGEVGA